MTLTAKRFEPPLADITTWPFPCLVVHKREPIIALISVAHVIIDNEPEWHDAVVISADKEIGYFIKINTRELEASYKLFTGSVQIAQE